MLGFGKKKHAGSKGQVTGVAADLRDEQRKSEIILNAIDDGVVLLDAEHVIQLFNPAAAKITGWDSGEAVGLDFRSVIKLVDTKSEPYDDTQNPFVRAFKEGVVIRDNTAVIMTPSQKHVAVSLVVSPLRDQEQNITAAVAVFRDVSEERKEEAQRAEFISTASHEMRTPVAAIEGYLALAMNDKVAKIDPKARNYLEKAHESTQHLGQLFQDLLTSARAEDGRLVSHPEVVEMGEYLEKMTDAFKFSAEKKGLLADFVIGTATSVGGAKPVSAGDHVVRPLYFVNIDPERMREVITNIFDNATKYTPQGSVQLGLTGNDEVVQIFVRDTGNGIPAEDISHLFQKFYRVDNSSTRTIGGTGLGLFICRKIVELYHGRIWVESELGKGSTFYINLPRLSTQRAAELQQQSVQGQTPPPVTSLTTPVV